jgi:hypothetical protein
MIEALYATIARTHVIGDRRASCREKVYVLV